VSASEQAAVVFTFKSIEHICAVGGTQSWRMHQSHFGTFDYVICARNRRREDVEGPEEHGSAFLIGKVRDIVPSTEHDDPEKPRFLIRMTEAAIIRDKPGFWQWGRWPTHYDSLDALGIDPSDYDFKPLPELLAEIRRTDGGFGEPSAPALPSRAPGRRTWKESIEHAKMSLATELGVDVEAIEIAVRM
jgi:hypothetical protein